MEREVVEEEDAEADSDHVTLIYYLLMEDVSVINKLLRHCHKLGLFVNYNLRIYYRHRQH